MNTLELVQFLSECADEAINKAASTKTGDVNSFLDEAEGLITLASKLIYRVGIDVRNIREVA